MREATIAAGVARGLIAFAVSKGASQAALVEAASLDPRTLEDQDDRIPFSSYVALMRAAKTQCDDPAFALHFGEALDMAEISIVGLIGQSCDSATDAFKLVNRYARLIVEVDSGSDDRFRMQPEIGHYWMIDTRPRPNDFHELTESTFARMAASMRRMGCGHFLKQVHVTHRAPDYRDDYDRIFGAPVVFESDRNALLIDQALAAYRNPNPSRYAFGVLSSHAEALLKSLDDSKTTRGRVEGMLIPALHTDEANIDAIAARMGISRQTLFRRLKAEGATFEHVLDELRRTMALHYLGEKRVSVNETAFLVGFSEAAAFSRAFKRWTGVSPRAYRTAGLDIDHRPEREPPR